MVIIGNEGSEGWRNQEDGAHKIATVYLLYLLSYTATTSKSCHSLNAHELLSHRLTCLKEGIAMKVALEAFNSRLININTQVFLIYDAYR